MPRPKALPKYSLTRAHLAEMGRVAVEWNATEYALQLGISQMLKTPFNHSVILTKPASLTGWADMLINLSREMPEHNSKTSALIKVLNRLGSLQAHRNNIIHAAWHRTMKAPTAVDPFFRIIKTDLATGAVFTKRGRKGPMLPVEFTAAEMKAIALQIFEARHEFWRILEPPSPLRQTRRRPSRRRAPHLPTSRKTL